METIEELCEKLRGNAKDICRGPIEERMLLDAVNKISETYKEKANKANALYHGAVDLREAQIEFWGRHSPMRFEKMLDEETKFDQMLSRISGGTNPLRPDLPLSASDVCATLSIISGEKQGQ